MPSRTVDNPEAEMQRKNLHRLSNRLPAQMAGQPKMTILNPTSTSLLPVAG